MQTEPDLVQAYFAAAAAPTDNIIDDEVDDARLLNNLYDLAKFRQPAAANSDGRRPLQYVKVPAAAALTSAASATISPSSSITSSTSSASCGVISRQLSGGERAAGGSSGQTYSCYSPAHRSSSAESTSWAVDNYPYHAAGAMHAIKPSLQSLQSLQSLPTPSPAGEPALVMSGAGQSMWLMTTNGQDSTWNIMNCSSTVVAADASDIINCAGMRMYCSCVFATVILLLLVLPLVMPADLPTPPYGLMLLPVGVLGFLIAEAIFMSPSPSSDSNS